MQTVNDLFCLNFYSLYHIWPLSSVAADWPLSLSQPFCIFASVCLCVTACSCVNSCPKGTKHLHKASLCPAARPKQLVAQPAESNDDTHLIITRPIYWSNVSSVFLQRVYLFLLLGGGPLHKGCVVDMDILIQTTDTRACSRATHTQKYTLDA